MRHQPYFLFNVFNLNEKLYLIEIVYAILDVQDSIGIRHARHLLLHEIALEPVLERRDFLDKP